MMRLSLIGMSGSGKSVWSVRLSEQGFRRFCCDDMIARKLAPELTGPNGTVAELGDWMGLPFEPQYGVRESQYLACEIEVLRSILEEMESLDHGSGEGIVIDTTGSVIYAGKDILARLAACSTVVHFSTPPEIQELMFKAYLANRRPVLWRGLFTREPGEADDAALGRCYPKLLAVRERLYEQLAHVTIDYHTLNQEGFGVIDFLDRIRGSMPFAPRGSQQC